MHLLLIVFIGIVTMGFSLYAKASHTLNTCTSMETCYVAAKQYLAKNVDIEAYPQYAYSSLPKRFNTGGERAFVFSPRQRAWAAYDRDGYFVAGGKANGGSHFCSDLGRPCRTPRGIHRVYSKGSPGCVSNKFPLGTGGAPMPYCMFFRGGYAIHGSPYISNNNSSHGCIRVKTTAAKWLSRYFIRPGTKVIVLSY